MSVVDDVPIRALGEHAMNIMPATSLQYPFDLWYSISVGEQCGMTCSCHIRMILCSGLCA